MLLKRLRLLLLKYIFRTLIRVKVSDINLTFQEMQKELSSGLDYKAMSWRSDRFVKKTNTNPY
jgi:hypothetical protein